MTSVGTLRAGGEGFGQQATEHVRLGAVLLFGDLLDFGHRFGAEPDREVAARVTSGHEKNRSTDTHSVGFRGTVLSMTATQELTDEQYDIADRIDLYLEGQGDERDFNASQLARAAKCSTGDVYPVLAWMVATSNIGVTGRGGAWVRYRQHRHGEVNR